MRPGLRFLAAEAALSSSITTRAVRYIRPRRPRENFYRIPRPSRIS